MALCNVHALAYVLIESPQTQAWQSFLAEVVGMRPLVADASGWQRFKMDAYHWRVAVVPGQTERLHTAGWEVDPGSDLSALAATLQAAGHRVELLSAADCAQRHIAAGLRLADPSGQWVELVQSCTLDYLPLHSPANVRSFETGFNGDMGLGHAVLPAGKLAETHRFYKEVLGFGDSDYMHFQFSPDPNDPGQGLHFMHVNNPRHHSLALYEDANNPVGCVHLMLEVLETDEVGYCLDRVEAAGIPVVSTLGRHTNDRMLSFYMATPTGFAMEFGTGGLQVDWDDFTPTVTTLPSLWGHKFNMPGE